MSLCFLIQERSRLEALLSAPASDPAVLVTALGAAFLLGAAHALTPGHGKAIVAAYLVGSRGRVSDAVYLGGVITVTHTATVFILGLAALYASQHVSLDRVYPWLSLLSGLLVAAVGGWLLLDRIGRARRGAHAHAHPHSHPHAPEGPGRAGLLSLGVSGGLVPCPEALVVLLISISLRRLGLGLAVLVAFSIGLATILIGIGVAMVAAGPFFARFARQTRWQRALPVASAAVVTALGLVIAAQSALRL